MNEEQILEGNIIIAKWLGAKYINDAPEDFPNGYFMWKDDIDEDIYEIDLPLEAKDFEFDLDSNLQWLCLEKIAKGKIKKYSIVDVLIDLEHLNDISIRINSKEDLFQAIIKYIKSQS